MSEQTLQMLHMAAPIVLMGALFYFMIWRPQRKEQNARKEMLNGLKKGDEIFTIGGMCGKIVELTEKTVVLEVAEGVKVTYLRTAVSGRQSAVK